MHARLSLALLFLLGLLLPPTPLYAQRVAGGTASLEVNEAHLGGPGPSDVSDAFVAALDPIPGLTAPLTHEGTGAGLSHTAKHYEDLSRLSNQKLKKVHGVGSGAGKGAQVGEFKGNMAKRASFLQKLGKALNAIDLVGSIAQVTGYAVEGDGIGALSTAVNKLLEKGAGWAGGTGGGAVGGPAGALVGAAAAAELHQRTTGKWIEGYEDEWRNERLRATHLGTDKLILIGRYRNAEISGRISFTLEGTSMRCLITGPYGEGRVAGNCQGTVAPDGSFSVPMSGTVSGGDQRYGFGGTVSGRLSPSGGSGTFQGAGDGTTESGTWTAAPP